MICKHCGKPVEWHPYGYKHSDGMFRCKPEVGSTQAEVQA